MKSIIFILLVLSGWDVKIKSDFEVSNRDSHYWKYIHESKNWSYFDRDGMYLNRVQFNSGLYEVIGIGKYDTLEHAQRAIEQSYHGAMFIAGPTTYTGVIFIPGPNGTIVEGNCSQDTVFGIPGQDIWQGGALWK